MVRAARVDLDPRVVARRQDVEPQTKDPLEQELELDARVAGDARVRLPSVPLSLDERLDHGGLESILHVPHVVRDPERRRDPSRAQPALV